MKIGYFVLAALLAGSPLAAETKPRGAGATSSVATVTKQAMCDQIAVSLLPDDQIGPQVDRFVDVSVDAMVRDEPGFAEMERTYPGLGAALKTAWRPVMLKASKNNVVPYRADIAKLYCTNLNIVDLRQTLSFFQSPEFSYLKGSVQDNIDYKNVAKDITSKHGLSASSIKGDLGAAGVRAVAALTPSHRAKVAAFFNSPTGRKVLALNPQKIELDRKWSSYVSPEAKAEIKQVTFDAMLSHIGKTDPESAARVKKELERQGLMPEDAHS